MNVAPIAEFLSERIGLDAASLGLSTFHAAVVEQMRTLALTDANAYAARLASCSDDLEGLLNRLLVPESWFFRGGELFPFLAREISASLQKDGERVFRILCLPCSTGEEPYSLAMALLARFPPEAGWQVEVAATDLSTKVLRAAQAALWPIEKADDIPVRHRKAFMLKGTGSQAGKMKAGPEIRSVVTFDRLNLNDDIYPVHGPFDFIFCRNVLIYFDLPSKTRVVARLLDHLAPGGCLFLGFAETATGINDQLASVGPNVYARAERGAGVELVRA